MVKVEQDPTARFDTGAYRGKRVLVIGSGSDLDNREMADIVDGPTYDVVARVNKHYGDPKRVGARTDVIFTRWPSWLDRQDWFSDREQARSQEIVILNVHVGYSRTEHEWLAKRIGVQQVSAGVMAVDFFLNRGAASVDIVGFGFKDGQWSKEKLYTTANPSHVPTSKTDGVKDINSAYDWTRERRWLKAEARVHPLP